MFAGLCQFCRRAMWRQTKDERGKLKSNAAETACTSCVAWMHDHPGQDPRNRKGNVAERIPAERPESDPHWRRSRLFECRDAPPGLFEPADDDDDPDAWKRREAVAATYCHRCPVMARCRRTALEQAYEGIWGGIFQTYERWTDLATGDYGPSVNMRGVVRAQIEKRAATARETRIALETVDTEPTAAELDDLEPLVAELVAC
jgi:hypothetical protein